MSKDKEFIFRRWIEEVWNQGREEVIEELFHREGVADYQHHIEDKPILGINDYKNFYRRIRENLADIKLTVEQIATVEDKIIAVLAFAAKRRRFEPEERPIRAMGLWQIKIENDQIVRIWSNFDWVKIKNWAQDDFSLKTFHVCGEKK